MSGIYISGMEMPNKCMECPCSGSYKSGLWVCEVTAELLTSTELNDGTPEFCPLIHVHDHGRLIDADALCDGLVSNHDVVIHAKCAPTIIPADKEDGRWKD